MRKRLAILIVFTSTLGITFQIFNTVFLIEETTGIIKGLDLFKYFTLQSNLIVAIYFAIYLIGNYKNKKFFNKMIGGVTTYISITFVVFFIILEPIFSPEGLSLAGSILNHYVTPILVLGFLYEFRIDYTLKNKDIKIWIIYPIIYLCFLIVHGLFTKDYLYPFFYVNEVGVAGLIISMFSLVILFFILSFSIVKIVSKK